MTGPTITLARKSGSAALLKRMAGLGELAAYVGVPASTSKERSAQLLGMAEKTTSKRKKARLQKAAKSDINNAELLFIFSKGSPVRNQPPRPVLEPAVEADGNKQAIAHELSGSVKASLAGDKPAAVKKMKRAALAGQNAARGWFTDSRNSWAQNAPSTLRRKAKIRYMGPVPLVGMDLGLDAVNTPGIDTGAMRAAIVGIVSEE